MSDATEVVERSGWTFKVLDPKAVLGKLTRCQRLWEVTAPDGARALVYDDARGRPLYTHTGVESPFVDAVRMYLLNGQA